MYSSKARDAFHAIRHVGYMILAPYILMNKHLTGDVVNITWLTLYPRLLTGWLTWELKSLKKHPHGGHPHPGRLGWQAARVATVLL